MSSLTLTHLGVLRRLAEHAHITNSDIGMDASVLSALLDLVSAPSDFPPGEDPSSPEHTVRLYARIHRLTAERDEARAEAAQLRAPLAAWTDAPTLTPADLAAAQAQALRRLNHDEES